VKLYEKLADAIGKLASRYAAFQRKEESDLAIR
jgi:hypothetical protein